MTRRIISVVLVALGVLAVALAVASATVWRPDDQATLSLPARPDTPVLLSEPGVLEAVDEQVTVRADADDDQPVTLAVGRTADVLAWVGDAPHTAITGLSSWQQLEVDSRAAGEAAEEPTGEAAEEPTGEAAEEPTGEAAEEPTGEPTEDPAVPDPAGSDLWVAEQTGSGQVELDWEHPGGRWSLLAVTDGGAPAPEVSLTWPVESRTPWLVPGLIVGTVLLVAGLALLVLDVMVAREAGRRRALGTERAQAQARSDASETDVLTAVGSGATRRELRERAKEEERRRRATPADEQAGSPAVSDEDVDATVRRAGPARGAGVVPAAADAQRHRSGAARDAAEPPEDELGAWFESAGARQPTDEPGPADAPTPEGEENGSSLERAAERFAEAADTEDHPPAERVEPTHSLPPEEESERAGGRRTGLLGFLRRRRRARAQEPGVLPVEAPGATAEGPATASSSGPDAEQPSADDEEGDQR